MHHLQRLGTISNGYVLYSKIISGRARGTGDRFRPPGSGCIPLQPPLSMLRYRIARESHIKLIPHDGSAHYIAIVPNTAAPRCISHTFPRHRRIQYIIKSRTSGSLRLDLLQVWVHLWITLHDSLHNLLDHAVLVRLDGLFNVGKLGFSRRVDRGLRGGGVG